MHFSLPDYETVRTSDEAFTVYKVYINGRHHASMRYSQFLTLHEKLGQVGGLKSLRPTFPPKKLLSLSPAQLEERRAGLERYIQTLAENEEIVGADIFRTYLRHVQHETTGEQLTSRSIHVFLSNGQEKLLELPSNAATSTLLRMVAEEFGLKSELIEFFALYFFQRMSTGLWKVIGRLEEFECPYVSLQRIGEDTRIVLRKCRWECDEDSLLEKDPIGLHLLYVQTVADIEGGWIQVDKEKLHALAVLQTQGKKADYVRLAKTLKYYGYLKFPECSTHFSSPMTIYLGNREMRFLSGKREELIFKVTFMKCWRITVEHVTEGKVRSELLFEYRVGVGNLEWLSIKSDEAILIGLCLQEMVHEMLARDNSKCHSSSSGNVSRSNSSTSSSDPGSAPLGEIRKLSPSDEGSRRRSSGSASATDILVGRRSGVRNARGGGGGTVLENSVFAGIGDDDL